MISGKGWIASQINDLLLASGKTVVTSLVRTENREEVLRFDIPQVSLKFLLPEGIT